MRQCLKLQRFDFENVYKLSSDTAMRLRAKRFIRRNMERTLRGNQYSISMHLKIKRHVRAAHPRKPPSREKVELLKTGTSSVRL